MKKIEKLEEQILEHQAKAAEAYEGAWTSEEVEYAMGYLDALADVVRGIEEVWGWTRLRG